MYRCCCHLIPNDSSEFGFHLFFVKFQDYDARNVDWYDEEVFDSDDEAEVDESDSAAMSLAFRNLVIVS
jgi:hypothetical protein